MTRFNGPVSRYGVTHVTQSHSRTTYEDGRDRHTATRLWVDTNHLPPKPTTRTNATRNLPTTGRSVIYIYTLLEYAGGIRTAVTTVVVVTAIGGSPFGIRVRRVATAHYHGTTTLCASTTTVLPTTSTNPQPFVHSTTESPTFKTAEATATTAVVSER